MGEEMLVAYAVIFCLAFTAAVLSGPVVRLLAVRVGAVDRPDGKRKIHSKPMPRLGGVVITVAVAGAMALYFVLTPQAAELTMRATTVVRAVGFAAGLLIILCLGIFDDVRGVSPRTKILGQTLAVAVCYAAGFRVESPLWSGGHLAWLSLPVTWFWIVACINAINLVDGMDGLASGVAFFVVGVIFVLAGFHSKVSVAVTAAAVLGGVVGFLMYNFHPAVMFLGDSGSMLLGYLVATLAIAGSMKSHATVALLIPILALGLPIMDTLLAILRRWSRGLPISQADREHVHHKLLAMGMSHKEAVIVLYCACLTLAAAALMVASANSWFAGLILGGLCVGVVAAVRIIGAAEVVAFLERLGERLRASSEEKQAAAHKRAEFLLAHARDWQEVRKALVSYAGSAGLVAVRICSPDASGTLLVEAVVGDRAAGSVRSEVKAIALDRGGAVAVVVEGGEAASLAVPGKLIAAVRTAVENVQAREQAAAEAAGPLEGRLAAP